MGCICDRLCPHGAQGFDAWDASCGSAAAPDSHTKSEMTSDKRTSVCLPIYLASRDFIFSCKDLSVDKPALGHLFRSSCLVCVCVCVCVCVRACVRARERMFVGRAGVSSL